MGQTIEFIRWLVALLGVVVFTQSAPVRPYSKSEEQWSYSGKLHPARVLEGGNSWINVFR